MNPTPTPAPTEDARWLSPEKRKGLGIRWSQMLDHATYMDERLKQAEALFANHIRIHDHAMAEAAETIADLHRQSAELIAAKDREIAELRMDREIVDWIENFIETGVLTTAFELDGGIHVTLATVGDTEERALRERNTFREAMAEVMAR